MISPQLKALLTAIRSKEAPKGYGQIYSGAKGVPKDTDVSKMTLGEVLAFQQKMRDAGSSSSACGGYQFIYKTLKATIAQMGLSLNQVWNADLQDRMAIWLLEGRGLSKFMAGKLSVEDFANNLSMEWASLPVVKSSNSVGSAFYGKKVGASFYDGDGLNKAHHTPTYILALVHNLRSGGIVPPAPEPVHKAPADKPHGLMTALIDFFALLFERKK